MPGNVVALFNLPVHATGVLPDFLHCHQVCTLESLRNVGRARSSIVPNGIYFGALENKRVQ